MTGTFRYPGTTANLSPTVVAVSYDNLMLCRNGSLPCGFANTQAGYPQLPFTYFAVNLNASKGDSRFDTMDANI